MMVQLDKDLHAVAEFVQANIPASRLRATAEAVAVLAPVIWGHCERECIVSAKLAELCH
jgi:hypothetical protein